MAVKKDDLKFYVFFLLLTIFLWNPLSYYVLYKNTSIIHSKVFKFIYILIPISIAIIVIFRTHFYKLNNKVKNLIFGLCSFGVMLKLLIVLNFLLGLLHPKPKIQHDYILPPNQTMHYTTVEYDVISNTNIYGFRNSVFNLKNEDSVYRILCFGDSWTYGWGVNSKESWPMILQALLLSNGYKNIQIINGGKTGSYSSIYKRHISYWGPILKPNLIIIGLHQLDDLSQLIENNYSDKMKIKSGQEFNFKTEFKFLIQSYLNSSFNQFSDLLHFNKDKLELRDDWKYKNQNYITHLGKLDKLRFYSLSDSVQKLALTGNLNPSLLQYYIDFPERSFLLNSPNHLLTRYAMHELQNDLACIDSICNKLESKLLIANLPSSVFTNHHIDMNYLENNFQKILISNNKVDSIYRSIAVTNKLNYIELTDHFKNLEDKTKYFYLYDGHPNRYGQNEIAKFIHHHLISNFKIYK